MGLGIFKPFDDLFNGISRAVDDLGRTVEGLGKSISQTVERFGESIGRAVTDLVAPIASSPEMNRAYQDATNVWTGASRAVFGGCFGNPPSLMPGKQPTYEVVPGQLFIKGKGDARDIDASDIQQGALGDCYFLASLSALAKANPELLRDMIRESGDGTYTVTFHQRRLPFEAGSGEFRAVEIQVSGELPMLNGSPAYSRPVDANGPNQELWVAILEKAYATYRGGYGLSVGGWPANAMETLTGVSSTSQDPHKVSLEHLRDRLKTGHAVAATTLIDLRVDATDLPDRTDSNPLFQSGRLAPSHVYTVVGVDVENGTVTLRNPWGDALGRSAEVVLSYAEFQEAFAEIAWNPTR
jgi:hypothetical protein